MAPKRARKVKGLLDSSENVYDAECIVSQRVSQATGTEYCVKWKGYPHYKNTWEPAANIIDPFLLPEFRRRLAENSITSTTEGDNRHNNDTSAHQDSTVAGQVRYPKRGILKNYGRFGSGGGRKRKVADRMGEGQGGNAKKKVKGRTAQPKKKLKNEVTSSKVTTKVKGTMTQPARYTIPSGPAYWHL